MSDYLPEDVLVKIFLGLPIKSIIVCTSVCKSWYDFITSPCFISTHLNTQDDHLLVRYLSKLQNERYSFHGIKEIYGLYCDNDNFDQYVQFSAKPPKCRNDYFNIIGCCNGLLCLSDDLSSYYNIYYLWNPSIRKSLKLPKPIFTFETHGPFGHTLGFGFDPVTNDYKVVRIVDLHDGCKRVPPRVELFKLSTGIWQDITHVSPYYMFFERKSGVFLNGACHWVAKSSNMIVLFDVHDETFREMRLPGSFCYNSLAADYLNLFVSEESLCLADHLGDDDHVRSYLRVKKKTIDIWRMKEYGDPKSWVKQFSVSKCISLNVSVVDKVESMYHGGRPRQVAHFLKKPIASRRNGEMLWRAGNGFLGLLVSYDIAAEKIKSLGIHNAYSRVVDNALYVNKYKLSLILLDKQTDCFAKDTGEESSNERNEAAHDKTEEKVSG